MTSEFSPEPLHDDRPVSPDDAVDDEIDDDLVDDEVTTPEDFEPADPDLEAIVDEDDDEDEDAVEDEDDGGRLGT